MAKAFTISEQKRQEILAAADAMEADGLKVTIKGVIDFMGGGSFEYVSPVLRDRRNARKPKFPIPSELPTPIVESIERVGAELWGAASRLADERIQQAQADADARREESDQQLSELEFQYAELSSDHEGMTGKKIALEEKYAEQENTLKARDEQLREVQEKLESTKEQLATSEDAFKDQVREYKTLNEHYERSRGEATSLHSTLDELKEKLTSTQQELTKALEQTASQQESIKTLQDTIRSRDDKLASLEEEKYEAAKLVQEAKDALEVQRQDFEGKAKKLETTVAGLQSRVDDRSIQIKKLESTNKDQANRIEKLVSVEADFKTCQARVQELIAEVNDLNQENKQLHKKNGEFKGQLESVRSTG